VNVLPLSYSLLNVICPLNNSASFWLNNPNEASPQTHEHVMLVPKLRTTRHLRRTQAPTFMRYMNRAPRGIRHPDIGTEPYKATTALWDSASSACNPVRHAQSHTRTREGMCALFQKPDSFTTIFDPQAF